jgi:hypothetical protein
LIEAVSRKLDIIIDPSLDGCATESLRLPIWPDRQDIYKPRKATSAQPPTRRTQVPLLVHRHRLEPDHIAGRKTLLQNKKLVSLSKTSSNRTKRQEAGSRRDQVGIRKEEKTPFITCRYAVPLLFPRKGHVHQEKGADGTPTPRRGESVM